MKPGNCSSSRSIIQGLVGLIVVVIFCLALSTTNPRGKTKLSLSYPDFYGLADFEISGFELGLSRSPTSQFGLGMGLGDKLSFSLGNWKLSPFLLGTFSSENPDLDDFTGSLEASYFDYRIGGWALSSTSRAWLGTTGYRFGGNGSYTLGNLSLAYDLQFENGFEEKNPWFPVRKGSYWTSLSRGSLSRFGNVSGSYLTMYGERRISLETGNLKWSQGVTLDSRGYPGSLGLVTRLAYRGSFFLIEVDGLKLGGWALQLTGENLSIGFVKSSGEHESYGISVGYRGDRTVGFEITSNKYDPEMSVELTVEW
ncbi:hypothetical protein K9M78_06795 [Candidatus Bipolaricaulota bacterium]|nr:hypothetical protein [Candidatus Bipolaricaulota bacterium]